MSAYAYQGDLYCGDCGAEIVGRLEELGVADEGDSQAYPQACEDGGGEADSPQHCGACGVFLANPLTADGWEYVVDRIMGVLTGGRGDPSVVTDWAEYYGVTLGDLLDRAENRSAT